jgi:hypothetical protein
MTNYAIEDVYDHHLAGIHLQNRILGHVWTRHELDEIMTLSSRFCLIQGCPLEHMKSLASPSNPFPRFWATRRRRASRQLQFFPVAGYRIRGSDWL